MIFRHGTFLSSDYGLACSVLKWCLLLRQTLLALDADRRSKWLPYVMWNQFLHSSVQAFGHTPVLGYSYVESSQTLWCFLNGSKGG